MARMKEGREYRTSEAPILPVSTQVFALNAARIPIGIPMRKVKIRPQKPNSAEIGNPGASMLLTGVSWK
jgi:ribosomal protein S12